MRGGPIGRRLFLSDLGRGAVAIAVVGGVGVAACSDDDEQVDATPTPGRPAAATTAKAADESAATPSTAVATPEPTETPEGSSSALGRVGWRRVQFILGSVSAYVLVRGGEAAVADTGVAGSADDIERALVAAGVGWDDVGHVILTHWHFDHAGGLPEVLRRATGATGYAGAADLAAIPSPRPLVAVGDGDRVFDLEIIETPGNTPGHISILDAAGGLLVAGDALNSVLSGGAVIGPNPQFTADLELANSSVVKLAQREFEMVVFGHGDPLIGGASAAVAALAADL